MKEAITKFDLEAAFKALDEIDMPAVNEGLKANRPALTEIFSRKTKLDALMEEYYDINSMEGLDDAKTAREAEVAKAKLARIEKIVDLDAENPEDILPSYVGKFIIQCPQCMTLFYKAPEDVVESEENPSVVNVEELCQHCGNDSGYTLIGKVGAATEEEQDEALGTQEIDVDGREADEETTSEETDVEETTEAAEDEEFEFDLDDISLDEEEPEEEEKTEEGLFNNHSGEALFEDLQEEADLEVSSSDFEALLKSPEFRQPISDAATRAMLNKMHSKKDTTEESLSEAIKDPEPDDYDYILEDSIDDMMYSGRFGASRFFLDAPTVKQLKKGSFIVTSADGKARIPVEFDMSDIHSSTLIFTANGKPFTTKIASEGQEFILQELANTRRKQFDLPVDENLEAHQTLEEGIFDKLKTRAAKANWMLANALKDYNEVKVTEKGTLDATADNRRFSTFIVIGYTDRYSNGKEIKTAPSYNNKDIVMGMNSPELTNKFNKAEMIAKGWSQRSGNGPAYIYLAKDAKDPKATFVCEYFKGDLVNDKVEDLFDKFRADLEGAKKMQRGGANQSTTKTVKASELTAGTSIALKNGSTGEVTSVTESDLIDGQLEVALKLADGKTTTFNVNKDSSISVIRATSNESIELAKVLNLIEELQETKLEKLIYESLKTAYGNIAGFNLTECACIDNKLTVEGTVKFKSGNTRKIAYTFNEASINDKKVTLRGINEKLDVNKKFTLVGNIENTTKTFIAEAFDCIKKDN